MAKGADTKTRLDLEIPEPKNEGDSWKVIVTAIASRGIQAHEGLEIQFYVDGTPNGGSVVTGFDGRAVTEFTVVKPGNYLVSAQITDEFLSAIKKSQSVPIKAEEKKSGKKVVSYIICKQMAPNAEGKRKLFCQVMNSDNTPAAKVAVRFFDHTLLGGYKDGVTDDIGNVSYEFTIPRKKGNKTIGVSVLGTNIETSEVVYT